MTSGSTSFCSLDGIGSNTVVLNSSPWDPLICIFCMSPLFNAPDSDLQLVGREIYELNWVCQIQKHTKCAEQWVPRTGIENHWSNIHVIGLDDLRSLYNSSSPIVIQFFLSCSRK